MSQQNKQLDEIFFNELRGKTVTEEQSSILKWAEERLKPALNRWHKQEIAEAKMQGWHEGRLAASNPDVQYGYDGNEALRSQVKVDKGEV